MFFIANTIVVLFEAIPESADELTDMTWPWRFKIRKHFSFHTHKMTSSILTDKFVSFAAASQHHFLHPACFLYYPSCTLISEQIEDEQTVKTRHSDEPTHSHKTATLLLWLDKLRNLAARWLVYGWLKLSFRPITRIVNYGLDADVWERAVYYSERDSQFGDRQYRQVRLRVLLNLGIII